MIAFVRPKIRCGLTNAKAKLVMVFPYTLQQSVFVGNAFDQMGGAVLEGPNQTGDFPDRILRNRRRKITKLLLRRVERRLQLFLQSR